jgi:hypothetical protein
MIMKKFDLLCECGQTIRELSVVKKGVCYRTDFLVKDGIDPNKFINIEDLRNNAICDTLLYEEDREYLDGKVKLIVYKCENCGEVIIDKDDSSDLNDFIRDSQFIFGDDIKQDSYGKLKIRRKKIG